MLAAAGYTVTAMLARLSLSISTLRVSLVPGAIRSTTYELARGFLSDAPGMATRRIPMLPVGAAGRLAGDANALDIGTMAPVPASNHRTIRRTRTFRLFFAQATEWVMVAE
jgi:hypothetical protein